MAKKLREQSVFAFAVAVKHTELHKPIRSLLILQRSLHALQFQDGSKERLKHRKNR